MMLKAAFSFKIILLLFIGQVACAQMREAAHDSLLKQMNYYGSKKASSLLFLHLDKTVYVNNDAIWFTAYLLDCPVADIARHQVLSVSLVKDDDQHIAVQGKFAMSHGLAFGSIIVPDTVPPGNYSIMAYTNSMINGRPDAFFVQPITIKTATQPIFDAVLYLDTLNKIPGMLRARLVADSKSMPLKGALVSYNLGKDLRTRVTGKAQTDAAGMYSLLIPQGKVTAAQRTLTVQVQYGKETRSLHLPLPVAHQVNDVKFYPEGGHLVTGLASRIGWEAKTPAGLSIKTSAVLYRDSKVIDTIETDSFGMGSFFMNTLAGATYTVKLLDIPADSLYTLPGALTDGPIINIPNALASDTLTLYIRDKSNEQIFLMVHNYKQEFISSIINTSVKGKYVKIDLSQVPRGLHTVTLLDSLQRPYAERLFFAHYDQKPQLSIIADKGGYGTRQKVNIKLRVANALGKPSTGVVSVACVQDNRFEVRNNNNIENYVYLQSEIDNLPLKENLLGNDELDHKYLNELLLVRGWSKYKWQEMLSALPADTIRKPDSLIFTGEATRLYTAMKQPVNVLLMKDSSGVGMLSTTKTGNFTLTNQDIYTIPDKEVRLIVSGKSDEYLIKVNDPYLPVSKTMAQTIMPVVYEEPLNLNTQEFVLKGFEHATNLHEVKITAKTDRFLSGYGSGANACGDYVCMFNILNCPNHTFDPRNRPPVAGQQYHVPGRGIEVYTGCGGMLDMPGMKVFPGIYAAKEFYGADYATINPTEPDYLSTILWKRCVILDKDKEVGLSFYTSDITGKYRIVVQGVTGNDVVYGEGSFMVQKKGP